MHDLFGSVRKSLVFRPSADGVGIGEKIGSCLRKSRVGFGLGLGFSPKLPAPVSEDEGPPIRWRKGELIGCGAFGQVYMGMNLDSGELLAVKQVVILFFFFLHFLNFSDDLGFAPRFLIRFFRLDLQVLIGRSSGKEKAQVIISGLLSVFLVFYLHVGLLMIGFIWKAHIRELEEEVKLLKNLSHPNIVVSAPCWAV